MKLTDGYVHYELANPPSGKPVAGTVVLVHGATAPYFIWDHNVPVLTQAGFRVLRYDLYGRGYSDRPDKPYTRELFVRQLLCLLDTLNIAEPVDLVGTSMGGIIVGAFADHHPLRARKLALVDPGGFRFEFPLLPGLLKHGILGERFMNAFAETILVKKLKRDLHKPEKFTERYEQMYHEQMKYKGFRHAVLSGLRDLPLDNMEDVYKRLVNQRPVIVIWGNNDKNDFVNRKRSEEILPDEVFRSIPEAGHMPHFEQPEKFNKILIEFLQK